MKLIRLESDLPLTTSYFTDNLAVPLSLEPGASVALKNISFQFEAPKLIIKDNTYQISFNTGEDANPDEFHTATLSTGSYYPNELMKELQNRMNALLTSDLVTPFSDDTYFQWKCELTGNANDGYICNIGFNREDPESVVQATSQMYNMQYLTNGFSKTGTDNNKYNSTMKPHKFLNGGGYTASLTIGPQVVGQTAVVANSQWYATISQKPLGTDFTETELLSNTPIAIGQGSGGKYKYKNNSGMVLSNLTIETGDGVEIYKQYVDEYTTRVVYSVTKSGGASTIFIGPTISTTELLEIGQGYHYFHLHIGNDTGKIAFSNVSHSPNPESTVTNGVYTIKPFPSKVIKDINKVNVEDTTVAISLTPNLEYLLGFTENSYIAHQLSGVFTADGVLASNIWNDDIVVEIPELNLSTYDHTYKQRRNIIMAIPAGDANNSVIAKGNDSYVLSWSETATFLYVPLNNKSSLQLPSLSVMVSSGGQMLPMTGKMSCLLLFKQDQLLT